MTKDKLFFPTIIDAVTSALKASNVKIVYNYPGRPATMLVDNIKNELKDIDVQDYLPNEFVASAKAFGTSVAGAERSLVIFKDVGINVAADNIYCLNHIGINRGLVFFIADDPSAWYSQNEEDSRGIYFNAKMPILEPFDATSAYYSVLVAYELSEIFRLPFFIRTTTRAIKEKFNPEINTVNNVQIPFNENFVDIPFDALNKWKSIFSTVEEDKEELNLKSVKLSEYYEDIGLNLVTEKGNLGIITSGFPGTQLENEKLVNDISLLKLTTLFPLPEKTIINFIKNKERVLIVDQGEPLLELLVRDLAYRNGLTVPILGKLNNFVRTVGEFRDDDLKISINAFKRNSSVNSFPKHNVIAKATAFEKNNGVRIMVECLHQAVKKTNVRPLYAADAGQTCRIPDTPGLEEMLHMEITMGASVPFLCGGVEPYIKSNQKIPFKGIAYVGDSCFFHSSFAGICEVVAKDYPILMLVIDNQGLVSTGKQSHLGMKINKATSLKSTIPAASSRVLSRFLPSAPVVAVKEVALKLLALIPQGKPRGFSLRNYKEIKPLSIKKILESLGVSFLEEANVLDKNDLIEKLIKGLKYDRTAVVIVHTE